MENRQQEYKERILLYQLYDRLTKLSDAFIMIERGAIISMSKIKRIEKGEVYLEGDIALPVGRTYSSVLKGVQETGFVLAFHPRI